MTEASALVGLLLATVLTLSNSCVHCNTPRSSKIKWQGVLKLLQWELFSVNFLNSRKKNGEGSSFSSFGVLVVLRVFGGLRFQDTPKTQNSDPRSMENSYSPDFWDFIALCHWWLASVFSVVEKWRNRQVTNSFDREMELNTSEKFSLGSDVCRVRRPLQFLFEDKVGSGRVNHNFHVTVHRLLEWGMLFIKFPGTDTPSRIRKT